MINGGFTAGDEVENYVQNDGTAATWWNLVFYLFGKFIVFIQNMVHF